MEKSLPIDSIKSFDNYHDSLTNHYAPAVFFDSLKREISFAGREGNQVAVIKATKVEVRKFSEVPDEFALAEGEGDLSGDDFRESHSSYWSRLGFEVKSDTEIVLLFFELVDTKL